MLNFSDDHCIFTFYVYYFFSVIREIRCEFSDKRGAEMLFISMFGHDVEQPSP